MSLIAVNGLSKAFDGKQVVKDLTFQLEPGKCVALLGPNGAGKTTTLRLLAGFTRPTEGNITFDEQSLSTDIRNYVGYLPQFPVFHNWMTGMEFLIYVGQLSYLSKSEATERASQLMDRVGIGDAKKQRIGKYSGGMRQRLGIAQALMNKPKLIMLDEPVSALDPIGRREVLNLMNELKKDATILFSTHILNDAEEVSDELLLLHRGELVEQGSLDQLNNLHQTGKIELTFSDNPDSLKEDLEKLSTVEHVDVHNRSVNIITSDEDATRKELLQYVTAKDLPLTKYEVAKTTLEDLFMKVVSK
ncbi:ABC transporter ATP-binding protein [Salinibacillus xinjiangensis]|uniref:ATP-binding cassette domain-containing protein n=1 Tax=Salinibacillus xinjiangensis TaxID=1229268 RepID=A0A6G1X9H0_9BACI|nr:ABC transporter ATP-binding protein [Salinibacillus xinjiangensis]MRG87520.1 ATP-binding cassette domain-containing protein [Salinibacillus xinjiangensis]